MSKHSLKSEQKIIARNKRAYHDYTVSDKVEAGIVLFGSEVKSIREGKIQLTDAYAISQDGEIFLVHLKIQEYAFSHQFGHLSQRSRKLLLHKKQIADLSQAVQKQGYTLLPLEVYFKDGKVKILLGVCKGKRQYDKRTDEKEKDIKRQLARIVK